MSKKKRLEELDQKYKSMPNAALLDQVIMLSQPDDYDGYMTKEGQEEYSIAHSILVDRLGDWLFIDLPDYETYIKNAKKQIVTRFNSMYNKAHKKDIELTKEAYFESMKLYFCVDIIY